MILIVPGGRVVISRQFEPWRTVGILMQALRMHEQRTADELLILDITASKQNRIIDSRIFELISANVSIPVTVGGGVKSVEIAKQYIRNGADRICVNGGALDNIDLIGEISKTLGSQAVVANICYRWIEGIPEVWDYRTRSKYDRIDLCSYISQLEDQGVGEIVLTSVDCDGSTNGADSKVIDFVFSSIQPKTSLIQAGGIGSEVHCEQVLGKGIVSAVAAGSIFNLREHTPNTIRAYLASKNIPIRI